ncbi:hypothetical protein CALVIDRAFT_534642 [Calocera viscosa TUFC12733]|uniref:Mid2 domain-containing protein n=1 Tax=Calocera viscosa (strain TUFC12733) TaxID=1330018 RepID=A0A167PTH7_CALVF|nr:hypothetical protein CALVIDRAFT_534642 [Calocera viscosa TUFC12733]
MPLLFVLCLALGLPVAHSWNFTIDTPPSECEPFSLSFAGGEAPYQFTFLRLPSLNSSVSVDGWGAGHALVMNETASPASITLPWAAGDPFVLIGSDATGFGTGGTTPVLGMAASQLPADSGENCLEDSTNNTYVDHIVAWNGGAVQCGLMSMVLTGVQSPLSLAVVIPGGPSTRYDDPNPSNTSTPEGMGILIAWYLTVPAGDDVFFFAEDGNGPLFVSTLMTVGAGSGTCFNDPESTSVLTNPGGPLETATTGSAATPTDVPVGSGSDSGGTGGGSNTAKIGAIVGGVVGGLLFIVGVAALVMFLMHRHNRRQRLLRQQTYGIAAYGPTRPVPAAVEGGEVVLKEMGPTETSEART